MATTPSNIDKFLSLSDAEKQIEVERTAKARGKPLTPEQRKKWDQVQAELKDAHRRKTGRPKVGQGARTISLTVEKGLLKRADAFAKKKKMSRAALVRMGLEAVLSGE